MATKLVPYNTRLKGMRSTSYSEEELAAICERLGDYREASEWRKAATETGQVTLVVLSRDRLDLPGLVATMPVSEALGYVRDLADIPELVIKIRPADGRSLTAAALPFRKLRDGSLAASMNGTDVLIQRHVPSARDRRIFSTPKVLWETLVDGDSVAMCATRREAIATARDCAGRAA